MKNLIKIGILAVLTLVVSGLRAQNENNILPYSNKLLLNPSFAGLHKNISLWTGLQVFSSSKQDVSNQFTLTYDTYSDKLKGGVAFYFHQGLLGEINTNTAEFGLSYAGFSIDAGNGKLIPSVGTNFMVATKQWFVFIVDYMLNKQIEPPSPPGEEFYRYYTYKPRAGILWDTPSSQLGISVTMPYKKILTSELNQNEKNPVSFIAYYAKKMQGNRNGLISKKYQVYPEVILFYKDGFLLSRTSLKMEHTDKTFALFVQNNFTLNFHSFGGTFGWRKDNLRLNLSSGVGIPVISDKITFSGEITLGLVIPQIQYSKINPWMPEKKLF